MNIRHYRPSHDKTAVERITRLAWHDVSMGHMREQRFGVLGGIPWQDRAAQHIAQKCEDYPDQAIVAEVDGQVVGYAIFGIGAGGDVGSIGENAVDPAHQGKGIGTRLVAQAIKIMLDKGVKMLDVQTFAHDFAARKVYERLGFEELAKTVHYIMSPARARAHIDIYTTHAE